MTLMAYVGCRTTRERNARGEGISVYEVNGETGGWTRVQVIKTEENPSFLAVHPSLNVLYSVHGDLDLVTFYQISPDGQISFFGKQYTRGRNPVHLAIDPSQRWLIVPNYKTDSLVSLPIASDGQLGPVADLAELPGTLGPHKVEQNYGRPHHVPFSPSGRWIVVPEKGNDQITVLKLDDVSGKLEVAHREQARESSGPRHVAFHPLLPRLYVLNELDSTVTTYEFNDETGRLGAVDILSALPRTFVGNSRASEIEISSDGTRLYTSNRGHDSITCFSVGGDGQLSIASWTPSHGQTPRFFALDPSQRWLYAANEDSDTIVPFRMHYDGTLSQDLQAIAVGSPTSIVFRNV